MLNVSPGRVTALPITTTPMKTNYGMEYEILTADELHRFDGYDRSVAQCHIANCGCIIVGTQYGQPIDNEYDLEEIYKQIKEK